MYDRSGYGVWSAGLGSISLNELASAEPTVSWAAWRIASVSLKVRKLQVKATRSRQWPNEANELVKPVASPASAARANEASQLSAAACASTSAASLMPICSCVGRTALVLSS
jgi:hypothetical protein